MDPDRLLARRWSGIRRALRGWLLVAAVPLVPGLVFGWVWPIAAGCATAGFAVVDAAARTFRTLRLQRLVRRPPASQQVRISRHYRSRHRLPPLEVVGLWPHGRPGDGEPPLSVRLEDIGPPLEEGEEVTVLGDLRPGGWVVLVDDGDRVVWPLRRVKAGLRPRRLGPYPFDDDDDEDDDGSDG